MAATRQRILPQFSLRLILGITTVTAAVCAVGAWATQGQPWAIGIVAAVVVTLAAFVMFAAIYVLAWLLALLRREKGRAPSPEQQPPAPNDTHAPPIPPSAATCLIIAGLVNSVLSGTAWAASGGSITLPTGNNNPTGLTLEISTKWVDSTGYRPVRVELTSTTGPVTADRVLTLRFRPRIGLTDRDSIIAQQVIELPAGATSTNATIAVPQLSMWGSFVLEVYEAGQYVPELSVPDTVSWTSWAGTFEGDLALPTMLLLSGNLPQSAFSLGSSVPQTIYFLPSGNAIELTVNDGGKGPHFTGLIKASDVLGASNGGSYSRLPTRWIDYSGIDMAIVELKDLQRMVKEEPAVWDAISQWIRNEGTLIVYGVGEKWKNLDDLQTILKIEEAGNDADPIKRGWKAPDKRIRSDELRGVLEDPSPAPASPQNISESPPASTNDIDRPFIMHPCGLGMVVAIPSGERFDAEAFDWKWLYNSLGPERWQWSLRHGVSIVRENPDYWNFLIPGIGLPPVGQFQLLITVFVIVIGPVSYYFLRRRGILNLMILTVPAGALLVTATLFAYAFLADGLGVRVRARSVTHIDQRLGEASCWARMSYYAGIAPAAGLTFSDDLVALPLELTPGNAGDLNNWETRTLDWRRREASSANSALVQNLKDGWLKSRTTTQFITGRIRPSQAKLEITPEADSNPLTIVNRLGAPIDKLVLIDDAGRCWTGESIAEENSAALAPVELQSTAWSRLFATIWNENEPRITDDIALYHQRIGYNFYNPRPQVVAPSQSMGIMERSLTEIRDQLSTDRLPRRTYVALVPRSPEVELGVENVSEEGSFHIIVGRW